MPYIYPDIQGAASPVHFSQLTFSDPWLGPNAFTHEVVGSTPGSATFPCAVCDPTRNQNTYNKTPTTKRLQQNVYNKTPTINRLVCLGLKVPCSY